MDQIKIGIVEDEVIIADCIRAMLEELNYVIPEPCGTYAEAVAMLENEHPDLMVLDINLSHSPDGIEIAKYIRERYHMPFIFLTADTDSETVNRAKMTRPEAFLVKPFQKADLYAAIEIALHNFISREPVAQQAPKWNIFPKDKEYIFIKDDMYFNKVSVKEILYLSADHVYVTVHTAEKKFLVRTALQQYLDHFDPDKMIRVHRSFAVNLDKVDKLTSNYILICGEKIPISKIYRDSVMQMLHIR